MNRCMVGGHVEGGPAPDQELALSRQMGKEWAIIRLYRQWDLPGRSVERTIAAGKLPVVSHKPPGGRWETLSRARETNPTLRHLAQAYAAFGRDREVVVIFHHEPHDDASDIKGGRAGTARDYIGAFRRFADTFHEHAPNVLVGYCAVGGWALGGYGRQKRPTDPLYPGDEYVDVECHDAYNWFRYHNTRWQSFEEDWRPLVDLARRRAHPLIAGEVGCHGGHDRDQWLRDMAAYLKSAHARGTFVGFCYFHSNHRDVEGWHDWRLFPRDGYAGYRAFADDDFFTPTPFPLRHLKPIPTPTPTPIPSPVPGHRAQLEEAARLQGRTLEEVLRRAVDHYMTCQRAGCPHAPDAVPPLADRR